MQRFKLVSVAVALGFPFASSAIARHDFNGDGVDDLVIGNIAEDVGGIVNAGQVEVVYGELGMPLGNGEAEAWNWQTLGLTGFIGGESLGNAIAGGDFNGDGFDDLAIGIPNRVVSGIDGAGSVVVLHGGPSGLGSPREWSQASKKIKDKPESVSGGAQERFGRALAAGDFDNDGRDDLAVGVLETIKGRVNAGAVAVLYGSKNGVNGKRDKLLHQDTKKFGDAAEALDDFGSVLCAGNFDGDDFDDLAVGVANELKSTAEGAVQIIFGSNKKGLKAKRNFVIFYEDVLPGPTVASTFANCLACGDFNDDGRDDLAVGNAFETANAVDGAGAVYVFPGSASGPSAAVMQRWFQSSPGLTTASQQGELFGISAVAADFDTDGKDDLAVGCVLDKVGMPFQGSALVLEGSASGLTATGHVLWSQDSTDVVEDGENFDDFGFSLGAGDFNGSGAPGLAVGVPFEDLPAGADAGGVVVILAVPVTGLTGTGSQFVIQGTLGLTGAPEASEGFGLILGS